MNKMHEKDIYLFHEGNNYRCHHFMGAHFSEKDNIKGVVFRVWAPNAFKVMVVGDFNQWNGKEHVMKKINSSGIWELFISNVNYWDNYKYEIINHNRKKIIKADPFAFHSQTRPETASKVISMDGYQWNDNRFLEEKKHINIYQEPLNIYEVHFGSWKRKSDGNFYSYRDLADDLISYIKQMKYTHVEIMPLVEHPLDDSWGYQGVGYFSVTSRYGIPQDFMYFVDQCHQNGIGVILDWVPGHFCKDDHGLRLFDGTPLYEYSDPLKSENQRWGACYFDLGKPEVMSFLISNAVFWLENFHLDGLRIDAVSSILYLDFDKEKTEWKPNKNGGRENLEAIEFLKKLNTVIFELFPNSIMVAEEATDFPLLTWPTELNGLGFNYKWNMGWMNDTLKYIKYNHVQRKHHHHNLTFSIMYTYSENFILPLSHDEVVHGKKSLLDKMSGEYWQKFSDLRNLFGYMMTHPGKKLLFMGGEMGQFIEWRFNEGLDWCLLEYEMHQKMQHYVQALNNFYLNEPSLWQYDHSEKGFKWVNCDNANQSVIIFLRKSENAADTLICICNFTPQSYDSYKIGAPFTGKYIEVMNSDRAEYGGSDVFNAGILKSKKEKYHDQPYSLTVKIPPLSTIIFKPSN